MRQKYLQIYLFKIFFAIFGWMEPRYGFTCSFQLISNEISRVASTLVQHRWMCQSYKFLRAVYINLGITSEKRNGQWEGDGEKAGAVIRLKSPDSSAPGCRRDVWTPVVSSEGIKQPSRLVGAELGTANFVTPFERADVLLYCEADRRHEAWIETCK